MSKPNMTQFIRIVFNNEIQQTIVDMIVDNILELLDEIEITAALFVGEEEEECSDERQET